MTFSLDWQADRVGNRVVDVLENAVYDGAKNVLKKAQIRCPVESIESVTQRSGSAKTRMYGASSGALKRSGRITRFKKRGVVGAYVSFGGITVDGVDTYYGPFVELGTPGTKFNSKKGYWGHPAKYRVAVEARPFLRPSLKSSRSKIRNAFRNKLK